MLNALVLLSLPTMAGSAKQFSPVYEGNCQLPRWSPDGSRLAYEVNFHDRKVIELYVLTPGAEPEPVRPVARGSTGITAGFTSASEEMVAHELSWSPPGMNTYIYSASGADRDYDLFLSTGSKIAEHPGADGGASWSPDGNKIAFTSARTGQGDVYLLDVTDLSAAPKQLTGDPSASELYIAWSPDSKQLAFVGHTRSGDNIYLIDDLDYPTPLPVTNWTHTQTRPSFSPDGGRLAFYSNHVDSKRFDLYVMPLGGSPTALVEDVVMNPGGPQWMPDGGEIITVINDDDRYDPIYRVPVDDPGSMTQVETGTVGNSDHDIATGTDGRVYLAVIAQGEAGGDARDFKRIFVMPLD